MNVINKKIVSDVLFNHGVGRKKLGVYWHQCRDGDDGAREIYDRHYSRYFYKDGRKPKLFVGPGEKMVLITENADALWVWRKFKDASGQKGLNNASFRNYLNSSVRSPTELLGPSPRHAPLGIENIVKLGLCLGACFKNIFTIEIGCPDVSLYIHINF